MKEELSDCCGAKFYDETDVCSACKEHSEAQEEDRYTPQFVLQVGLF